MDHSISPPGDSILWGKAQALNEKTVAGVGFLVFLLVVVGSIVIRLSLEVNARHEVDSARTGVDDHLGVEPGIVPTTWFDSVLKWFPPRIEQIQSGEISGNEMNVLLFGRAPDISAQIAVGRALTKLAGPEGRVLNDLQVVSVDSLPLAAKERKQ